MPQGFGLGQLDHVGVVGICLILFYLFLTDRLVSGKRLRESEKQRARWETVAFEAITASRTAMLPAAEAVHALVTHLPDPGAEPSGDGTEDEP